MEREQMGKDNPAEEIVLSPSTDLHAGAQENTEPRVLVEEHAPYLFAAGVPDWRTCAPVRSLFAHMLRRAEHRDWRLLFFFHGTSEGNVTATASGEDALAQADELVSECRRRMDLFESAGVSRVDEYDALMGSGEKLRGVLVALKEPGLFSREFIDRFSSVSELGRPVGVHLIAATNPAAGSGEEVPNDRKAE